MKLKRLGEDAFIKEIEKIFRCQPDKTGSRVVKGIGDDTAVTENKKDTLLLSTTDTLVEGVHFDVSYAPPHLIGKKALAISLSDIAAMGGTPLFFLLSVSLPKTLGSGFATKLLKGMKDCATKHGITLIGGNTTASSRIIITTTVLGEVSKGTVVYRRGAKPGDSIFVTGTLGGSALGLKALKKYGKAAIRSKAFGISAKKHLSPEPRVIAGRLLAQKRLASAMTDVSDGLIRDLKHITGQSSAGAAIESEKIPLSKETQGYLKKHPSAIKTILCGGEDYELLFTANPEAEQSIRNVSKRLGLRISCIGKILPKNKGVAILDEKGRKINVKEEGFEHFR
ncbi:MAG: thiamine-phosphate kinase [Thermodesulfobacteriota bacterium]